MSNIAVRAALETALDAMAPALPTAWENRHFTPPAAVNGAMQPYQAVFVLFTDPNNPEMGRGYQERGYMQVNLVYPENGGSAAIGARAKLLRDTFYRGRSFVNSGVTVTIINTPAIGNGSPADGRYNLPVKIPFEANVL